MVNNSRTGDSKSRPPKKSDLEIEIYASFLAALQQEFFIVTLDLNVVADVTITLREVGKFGVCGFLAERIAVTAIRALAKTPDDEIHRIVFVGIVIAQVFPVHDSPVLSAKEFRVATNFLMQEKTTVEFCVAILCRLAQQAQRKIFAAFVSNRKIEMLCGTLDFFAEIFGRVIS